MRLVRFGAIDVEHWVRAGLRAVEPRRDPLVALRGYLKARQLAALERHQLPARYGSIAPLSWRISPAAFGGALRVDNEGYRPLGRLSQLRIERHAIGLAQGNRGHAVAVKPD